MQSRERNFALLAGLHSVSFRGSRLFCMIIDPDKSPSYLHRIIVNLPWSGRGFMRSRAGRTVVLSAGLAKLSGIRQIACWVVWMIVVGWAGLLMAEPVVVQGPFDRWDADRDGWLSREELPPPLQARFFQIDRDRDGRLSREEFSRLRPPDDASRVAGVRRVLDLDYAGTNHPRQRLDLFLPEHPVGEGPLPLVIFIHGGAWQSGSKERGEARLAPLLETGRYAGAAIGYRLTDEVIWPAQLHDVKAAIRWLQAHAEEYGLDPDRIAVWGASAGGHLAAMAGVTSGDPAFEGVLGPHTERAGTVRVVVNFFGPSDFLRMDEQGSRMQHSGPNSPESKLVGGPLAERLDQVRDASPVVHATAGDPPMLLVHGSVDPVVPHGQSLILSERLIEVGVDAPLITVEGGGHGEGFGASVQDAVLAFLGYYLLGEGAPPRAGVIPAGR